MDRALTRMARLLGIAGVATVVFGVVVLLWPGISLVALTSLFGAFAFVYGVFGLGAGLNLLAHRRTEWVGPVVGGLGGVLIGAITFLHPAMTVPALTYLIAAWAFVSGIAMIVGAVDLWSEMKGAVWHALAGALRILFGVTVAFWPGAGLLAILWLIGAYALAGGILELIAAYRIHRFHNEAKQVIRPPQPSASWPVSSPARSPSPAGAPRTPQRRPRRASTWIGHGSRFTGVPAPGGRPRRWCDDRVSRSWRSRPEMAHSSPRGERPSPLQRSELPPGK